MTGPAGGADPDPAVVPAVDRPVDPAAGRAPEPRRTSGRGPGRARWVLVLLVLSGLVGLTALPAWVTATGVSPVVGEVALTVGGGTAAPGLVAAALVLLAAAGALGLVGRAGRWVVVGVVAAAGALVVASALGARSGATAAAERAAAEATGVSSLAGGPHVGVWPWVASALGVLVVAAAVGLARASGGWSAPSDRHERAAPSGPVVAGAATGSVPDVQRPTAAGGTGGPGGPGRAAGPSGPGGPGVVDERSTWDALSRGDDPT